MYDGKFDESSKVPIFKISHCIFHFFGLPYASVKPTEKYETDSNSMSNKICTNDIPHI